MKEFERITDALREVKRLSINMDIHDSIYLVSNEELGVYYVAEYDFEIAEMIEQNWKDSGCELEAEEEVREYKIFEYVSSENVTSFPATHGSGVKSLLRSQTPLVREEKQIHCEYTVDFVIHG